MRDIRAQVLADAEAYARAGVDAVMLENMHDVPYLKREVGPEITACMAVLGHEIRQRVGVPCGLQILAGANQAALAAALAAELDFIRAEGYVFGHLADEGYIDACAGPLLRYRRAIGAEHIAVLCDIQKKHSSHVLTSDLDIAELARAAEYFGCDGVIVTGSATGCAADLEQVRSAREAVEVPVLIGSGVTPDNLAACLERAHGLIIGSWLKVDGRWENPVDLERATSLMRQVRALRGF